MPTRLRLAGIVGDHPREDPNPLPEAEIVPLE